MDYAPCNDNCKLNYHFRMQRRRELVQRLRDHFKAGRATDKVPVTTTRTFLNGFCNKLSEVECGLIVKRAFPSAQRKRSNNTWYYYGLQCKDQLKAANTTLPDYTGNMYCKPSSSKKETPEEEYQNASEAACSDDRILKEQAVSRSSDFHEDTNATKGVKMFVDIINQQVDLIRAPEIMQSSKQAEQQAYCKPFCIPSLNLCKEDMSDLEAGQLIGEGTFGYCIAGSYKGIPTAFKIFKDLSDYKEVHTEANFLLKIPSHPGIPLLIGVCTSSTPFVLATKLCETVGKPETFSSFLRGQQKFSKPNLPLALKLLLSIGEVLNHLFSVGILHNDIKGNNVVLEDANDLKRGVLIDFGKACYAAEAKESVRHRLMNFNERRLYRERFPHVAPEVSDGKKPSQSSDIYSFGHMYCLTMKAMKDVLGTQEKQLLELGKQISHFRPHKRPNIAMVLEKLAIFSSSYPE